MSWRLAYSLESLRTQLNVTYPLRDKTSDGTIGDISHSHTASDHNPNAQGVVCAMDIDNDLSANFSAHDLAEIMRVNRHPDLKYIISKDRICSARDNWAWRKYSGYRHDKHIHVSVGVGSDGQSRQPYDDRDLWTISPNGNSSTVEKRYKMYDVKKSKLITVKVQTGDNGAGYTDVPVGIKGLMGGGHCWSGNSARGLSCAVEDIGGGIYRVGVEGAPGAYLISVNVTLVEV